MGTKPHFLPSSAAALLAAVLLFSSLVPVQAASDTPDFNAATHVVAAGAAALALQKPTITVWYENALNFGQIGNPQDQINILGNVSDPSGSVASLTYSLNGGPETNLSLGKSNPRLVNIDDFNINISIAGLQSGTYSVLIRAKDKNSAVLQTKTVSFNYTAGQVWPLPYTTNWAAAGNISEQAQIVDGLWDLSASGVRPALTGYDRVIAIGDTSWTDYEVLAKVTIHNFPISGTGGVGIITHWSGHFQVTAGEQPPSGWWQIGAYGYYSNSRKALALRMNKDESTVYTQTYPFSLNKTYLMKLRSETISGVSRYSFKIWEAGTPEPSWNDSHFSNLVNKTDPTGAHETHGSVLLVAHQADATFGDVTICPLNGVNYTLNTSASGGGKVIAQPAQASYACGQGLTLTAKADQGWVFTGWSGGIQSSSPTISFNMVQDYNLIANFSPADLILRERVYIPLVGR